MIDFDRRWGGLMLPPAPAYEGGPRWFQSDVPEPTPDGGWWFAAGDQRSSVPFSFWIGPNDEFGLRAMGRWAALHASVEGWVESVTLAHRAALFARQVTQLSGAEVDALDLSGFDAVAAVRGVADTWWRRPGSCVAVFRGEYEVYPRERYSRLVRAIVYEGLPDYWTD
jgi:hypothetical protein